MKINKEGARTGNLVVGAEEAEVAGGEVIGYDARSLNDADDDTDEGSMTRKLLHSDWQTKLKVILSFLQVQKNTPPPPLKTKTVTTAKNPKPQKTDPIPGFGIAEPKR